MILNEKVYRRNVETGEICRREWVEVRCNECKGKRSIKYATALSLGEEHLCASCAGKRAKPTQLETRKCLCCGCDVVRPQWQFGQRTYCNVQCRDKHWCDEKYGKVIGRWELHPDEVAYLCGMVLGDGHLKKANGYKKANLKHTTRICIAFDEKYPELLRQALQVCGTLGIDVHVEPLSHKHCQMIGFTLPDDLLNKYGMLFSGSKYAAQPSPVSAVVSNISFAAGLINSDGCYQKRNGKYGHYVVNGVTQSIVEAFATCLKENGIQFKQYSYPGRIDVRTGNVGKRSFSVSVHRRQDVCHLQNAVVFQMKGK